MAVTLLQSITWLYDVQRPTSSGLLLSLNWGYSSPPTGQQTPDSQQGIDVIFAFCSTCSAKFKNNMGNFVYAKYENNVGFFYTIIVVPNTE